MGKPRSHIGTGWRDQWERVQRWHRRIERFRDATPLETDPGKREALDEVFAFFMNCYHLADWLANDAEDPHPGVRDFVKASEPLRLCRDVCHGLKHYRLDPARAPAGAMLNWTTLSLTFRNRSRAAVASYWVFVTHDGRQRGIFQTADECMAAWRTFLSRGSDPIE